MSKNDCDCSCAWTESVDAIDENGSLIDAINAAFELGFELGAPNASTLESSLVEDTPKPSSPESVLVCTLFTPERCEPP